MTGVEEDPKMKRTYLVIFVGLIVALFVTAAAAIPSVSPALAATDHEAASGQPRLVTTTGDAEIRVQPDEIVLTLGVETSHRDLAMAKQQNDAIVQRLLAVADKYEIEPKQVQTDYLSIEPRYRDNYDQRDFIGYFVRKTVVITLHDLGHFEDVLSESLLAGANYVHGIEFRTTELRKYRDQARLLALQAAREKAQALAGELGETLGDAQTVSEQQNDWWSSYGSGWGGGWGNAMTQNVIQNSGSGTSAPQGSLAPGQITVSARVQASFELRQASRASQ
jgi:uncharacterized protein